ncbi:hypothetical protein TNCV_2504611 [Trichonephila clavipes]|uniref:Uncharacterized protein n=1 Tax=Trichonephila clavipes TaxID=2585209 RepID=A0A8X7BK47_TRICX|nr:hypothetical protein TNCV_2504611 [Trichonephila clavipes]
MAASSSPLIPTPLAHDDNHGEEHPKGGVRTRLSMNFAHSKLNIKLIDFHDLLLIPISYHSGSFAMQAEGGNCLVPGPDYMMDALKLPNQAPSVSGESLQTCVAWRCPDGTQYLFFWPILTVSGQSLASNGPVVDSKDLNLVFGHTEATHNKLFLSSPTKYTVEPSWPLVLVWPPFELLHRSLTPIIFPQYCHM